MAELTNEQRGDLLDDLNTLEQLNAEMIVGVNSGRSTAELINTLEDIETAVSHIRSFLEDKDG